MEDLSRRQFLSVGAGVAGSLLIPSAAKALILPKSMTQKTLHLHSTHTGEFFKGAFWEKGRYIPEALKKINCLLRDWRTNEVIAIDPKLLDLVYSLKTKLGYTNPLDIICGYRSPKTNNMLCKRSGGVAKKSLHLVGRAVDIRFNNPCRLRNAHQAASALRLGGVGFYPGSKDRFIHVDIRPRVAHWVG